jgi:hypothetical protein
VQDERLRRDASQLEASRLVGFEAVVMWRFAVR